MAKRMFVREVVRSDQFLELPTSTRELYFQICLDADDDGFVQNIKTISKMLEATETDIKNLIKQGFLLDLEDNIFLITHWNIHNNIRKDRKKNTIYQTKLKLVELAKNKQYILRSENNENNESNENNENNENNKNVYGIFNNIYLTDDEYEEAVKELGEKETENLINQLSDYINTTGRQYKDHLKGLYVFHEKNNESTSGKFLEI